MVTSVGISMGSGLKDWLVQRVTAVYFGIYSFFILGFIVFHSPLNYAQWSELFHCGYFQIASVIALTAVSLHAWIGIWTVTTDYIKCSMIRISLQLFVVFWLLCQYIWGLMIVWGL